MGEAQRPRLGNAEPWGLGDPATDRGMPVHARPTLAGPRASSQLPSADAKRISYHLGDGQLWVELLDREERRALSIAYCRNQLSHHEYFERWNEMVNSPLMLLIYIIFLAERTYKHAKDFDRHRIPLVLHLHDSGEGHTGSYDEVVRCAREAAHNPTGDTGKKLRVGLALLFSFRERDVLTAEEAAWLTALLFNLRGPQDAGVA